MKTSHSTATTCPYCGVGCGVVATTERDRLIEVRGDDTHPANLGRLCVKGSHLAETQYHSNRLHHPQIDGSRTSWNTALNTVATEFSRIIRDHGPDSVAFYLSGQLLTEDYYVANKLMKGFIGSGNVDTNSRLCMASAVAAHKRAFGEDVVPCTYNDLDTCDLLVLAGTNAAWAHPVVYQKMVAAKKRKNTQVVVIDPRSTPTCDIADLHLPILPGSDVALFNGLLTHLADTGAVDAAFLRQHTQHFDESIVAAKIPLPEIAKITGIEPGLLLQFYRRFAAHPRTVTLFSQGINQSTSGTDKANAIINCHLATGRIGKPGAGPFSITGQPNAMGGREVGGMANQLAAHMDFTPRHLERVARFWQAPNIATQPGKKAVQMFDAVGRGDIKAIWIMATNPAATLPNARKVREALSRCPFVVVSDCVAATDTTAYATVLLPARGWGEKDGTVTNSERCVSRQRAFAKPQGEARADWQIVCDVAKRMGFGSAFNYETPRDIFAEHAALSGFENDGERMFDISARANLSNADYEQIEPFYWPASTQPFANKQFSTKTGRANFVATPVKPAAQQTTAALPFVLNTGRLRDQWHTMTRTGTAPRLFQHAALPTLWINPEDAEVLDIHNDDLVEVDNDRGHLRALAQLTDQVAPGQLFAPMHWTHQHAGPIRVSDLVESVTDPVSGQPESKHAAVALKKAVVGSWVRIHSLTQSPKAILQDHDTILFWAGTPSEAGWQYECAMNVSNPEAVIARLTKRSGVSYCASYTSDRLPPETRWLGIDSGTPTWIAFATADRRQLPNQAVLATSLTRASLPMWRRLTVSGVPNDRASPIVCSCFEIDENQIRNEIANGNRTAQMLAKRLKCGTNCGSCVPELNGLIKAAPKMTSTQNPSKTLIDPETAQIS